VTASPEAGAVLSEIKIGERLRAIRNLRRYTLKETAERAGLSESFLSQVERDQAGASLASLQRIVAALGVNISDLFEPDGLRKPRVLRAHARPVLAFGNLGHKYLLTPRPLERLEVLVCAFEVGGSTGDEPYTHGDSEELMVVLSGEIHLQLGTDVYELEAGDSIDYRSSVPHRVVNTGDELAEVMFIMSPPSL
jgi:transcriptional regulator with XRE-family HTH domain